MRIKARSYQRYYTDKTYQRVLMFKNGYGINMTRRWGQAGYKLTLIRGTIDSWYEVGDPTKHLGYNAAYPLTHQQCLRIAAIVAREPERLTDVWPRVRVRALARAGRIQIGCNQYLIPDSSLDVNLSPALVFANSQEWKE